MQETDGDRLLCMHGMLACTYMCELEYCMNALKMSTALLSETLFYSCRTMYIPNSNKHVHTYVTHISQV